MQHIHKEALGLFFDIVRRWSVGVKKQSSGRGKNVDWVRGKNVRLRGEMTQEDRRLYHEGFCYHNFVSQLIRITDDAQHSRFESQPNWDFSTSGTN